MINLKELQEQVNNLNENFSRMCNNKVEKIEVGNLTRKEAEEKINLAYGDYSNSLDFDKFTEIDVYSMDEIADKLEKKHQDQDNWESYAIMKMIDFYRNNKK